MELTGKQAIKFVSDHFGVHSYYALAKALSDDDLTVQPIQISNYYTKDKQMSKKVAERFELVYGITITDVYDPGAIRKEYNV
jgi:hypothetical protein